MLRIARSPSTICSMARHGQPHCSHLPLSGIECDLRQQREAFETSRGVLAVLVRQHESKLPCSRAVQPWLAPMEVACVIRAPIIVPIIVSQSRQTLSMPGRGGTYSMANLRGIVGRRPSKKKQIMKHAKAARLQAPKTSRRSHRLTAWTEFDISVDLLQSACALSSGQTAACMILCV